MSNLTPHILWRNHCLFLHGRRVVRMLAALHPRRKMMGKILSALVMLSSSLTRKMLVLTSQLLPRYANSIAVPNFFQI